MEKLIMIKYGELTTKKQNRKEFINLLDRNIKRMLSDNDIEIRKDRVRMYIRVFDGKFDEVVDKLLCVFGLHGIVIVNKVNTDTEEIENEVLRMIKDIDGKTFKVETKRADKKFPIQSMEFNRVIATSVLKNTELRVDVHNPDIRINIEIRQEGTFLYTNEIRGIGGYPVGVQGKGMLMLSGGIDSPVAGYLALKRGVELECIYFESLPHTSLEARNKVLELARLVNKYSGNIKVHVANFTPIQEAIYKTGDDKYIITVMRRMMYRISEKLARKRKCKVLINGESIGQVASQTLDSMAVINEVVTMPVIRPVACMDKLEIIDLSKKINTYETSILPFEDCCTIFLPKHPVIHPKRDTAIEVERNFDYERLVDECVDSILTITDFDTENYQEYL